MQFTRFGEGERERRARLSINKIKFYYVIVANELQRRGSESANKVFTIDDKELIDKI